MIVKIITDLIGKGTRTACVGKWREISALGRIFLSDIETDPVS